MPRLTNGALAFVFLMALIAGVSIGVLIAEIVS